VLLHQSKQTENAKPYMRQCYEIFKKRLGDQHEYTEATRDWLDQNIGDM